MDELRKLSQISAGEMLRSTMICAESQAHKACVDILSSQHPPCHSRAPPLAPRTSFAATGGGSSDGCWRRAGRWAVAEADVRRRSELSSTGGRRAGRRMGQLWRRRRRRDGCVSRVRGELGEEGADREDGRRDGVGMSEVGRGRAAGYGKRTSSRRWLAETGEPAAPSCLYNDDDMAANKLINSPVTRIGRIRCNCPELRALRGCLLLLLLAHHD